MINTKNMDNILRQLKNDFQDNNDLIIKKMRNFYVIFLDSLCSQDKINEYILKRFNHKINYLGSNEKIVNSYKEIENYLYNGFTIILNKKEITAIETKGNIVRAVASNEKEPSMKGPKNAFVENYQTNLGLIKRRIKTSKLNVQNLNIGRISKCNVGILSINGIVKKDLLDKVISKLSNIDIDIINDSENLIPYLEDKSIFPTIISTERPDRACKALSEGKIVIICDESPNVLILPGFLVDFINPFTDIYSKNKNIDFTKIIRLLCFFLSIIVPAFYIAIINYNQETIPTSLMVNFAVQRDKVPFPATVECLIMLIICEILRESDLRFPNKYGSAISILGALILGDAAVSAGLVSPIMIIITAFTYISSLIFAEIEVGNAIRFYRFICLLSSAFFGLYGLFICIIFLFINLCDTKSLGIPYTMPLSPFEKNYFKDTFIQLKNKYRSKYLSNNVKKENF